MRTFIISKQIEAESAKEALEREKKAVIIGVVPAAPHVMEQLSAAIGTPVTDEEALQPLGFKQTKKKRR